MEEQKKPDVPAKQSKLSPEQKTAAYALMEAGTEFAVIIALPLLVFVYIRHHWHKENSVAFTIIGILLALGFSATAIGIRIKEIKKKLIK